MDGRGGFAKLPERSSNKWRDVRQWHKADIGHYRYHCRGAKPVQTFYSLISFLFGGSLSRLRSSRMPFPSRNSTPCFSNVTLIALRFRSCMRGLPSTLSAREIAECDTPHRLASSRADQLRSARAARNCAPVIVGFKASDPQKWPLTRDIPLTPIKFRFWPTRLYLCTRPNRHRATERFTRPWTTRSIARSDSAKTVCKLNTRANSAASIPRKAN